MMERGTKRKRPWVSDDAINTSQRRNKCFRKVIFNKLHLINSLVIQIVRVLLNCVYHYLHKMATCTFLKVHLLEYPYPYSFPSFVQHNISTFLTVFVCDYNETNIEPYSLITS